MYQMRLTTQFLPNPYGNFAVSFFRSTWIDKPKRVFSSVPWIWQSTASEMTRKARKMRIFIICLLLGTLVGVTPPPVSAQQNQTPHQSAQEIEDLKKRVSVLEKQLQVMENVDKMELVKNYTDVKAKLADANAKLANAEFAKFERELRDANDSWLIKWGIFGLTLLAVVGAGALAWLKSRTNQLIADEVEKSLNGFQEALKDLNTLRPQLRVLEKEHTFSVLESWAGFSAQDERGHPEPIKALREEVLLEVLTDERYQDESHGLEVKSKAMQILAARRSSKSVIPALELLNSVVDSESDIDVDARQYLEHITGLFSYINTQEAYQGLITFLHRLLTENHKHRDVLLEVFVRPSVYSIAFSGLKLNLGDSVSTLRLAIPSLEIRHSDGTAQNNLARYFDIFHELEGIKEILEYHGTTLSSEVVDKCLKLLRKHDPEFVETWRVQNTTDDSES